MSENDKHAERAGIRPKPAVPPTNPYGDGLDELPPNIPPGFLGETGVDLRKVDGDGSHGLNAGVIQEWTAETTLIVVMLAYILFFPLAFVILWRSRKFSRRQKTVSSVLMAVGIAYFAARLLGWF